MITIENRVSSGETIPVDDKHFVKCRFTKCNLMFSGGDVALTDTVIENCQVQLAGPAQRTASFLAMMGVLPSPNGTLPVKVPGKLQ